MRAPRVLFTAAYVCLLLASAAPVDAGSFEAPAASGGASAQHAKHGQHQGHKKPKPSPGAERADGSEQHEGGHGEQVPQEYPPFIPRLTDEDRKAAFPEVDGHTVHDRAVHSFVLFDQLEWRAGGDASGLSLDTKGWIGRDRDRVWFRAEAGSEGGRVDDADVHVLFGRQFSRWWDVVAGVRQDFRPGPAQTWAAVGVQGLAPYWFEVEATAYVGASGRTQARFEVEYELLLTNRWMLQPLAELVLTGKSDPERGIGAGVSMTDVGFRLRYEYRREFAPYVGVTWHRKYGKTADFAEAAGGHTGGAQLIAGLRLWF